MRDFHKSRAVAWLFLLATTPISASEHIQPGEPARLAMPLDGVRGIGLAFGAGGELIELAGPVPRLLVWNVAGEFTGEFQTEENRDFAPVDICSDGGFGYLAVDPLKPTIFRYGRRGESLPSIPLDSKTALEPVSICAGDDGRAYLINRIDGDIWRVESDGRASPLMIPTPLRVSNDNAQLNFDQYHALIWMLKGATLTSISTGGETRRTFALPLKSVLDFALVDRTIWVVGDGLAALDIPTGQNIRTWPADTLRAWGVSHPVSVAVHSSRLAILGEDGLVVLMDLP